jgi:hypothetical protein
MDLEKNTSQDGSRQVLTIGVQLSLIKAPINYRYNAQNLQSDEPLPESTLPNISSLSITFMCQILLILYNT